MANKRRITADMERKAGKKSLINRQLLHDAITDKEIKELIKLYYITAYNGNTRAQEYFIDQFIGKAAQDSEKDSGATVNIFDLLKKK